MSRVLASVWSFLLPAIRQESSGITGIWLLSRLLQGRGGWHILSDLLMSLCWAVLLNLRVLEFCRSSLWMRLAHMQAVLLPKHAANKRRVLSKSRGLQLCWHPRATRVLFALLWLSQGNESWCSIRPLVLFHLQQHQMLCRKRWRVNYLFSVTKMNTEIISTSFGLFLSWSLLINSLRSDISCSWL